MSAVQMGGNTTHVGKQMQMEFTCKGCQTKCRVDTSIEVASGLQYYRHCDADEERHLLQGPIIAVSEERRGTWVLVGRYT
jgi:hypothetical protein